MNLSLDGIHRDESGFLNGSRTAHCESLKRLRSKSPFFSGAASKLSFPPQVSQVTLFTRQKLFYSEGGLQKSQNKEPHHPTEETGGGKDVWEGIISALSCQHEPYLPFLISSYSLGRKEVTAVFQHIHLSVILYYLFFKTQWYFLRVQKIEL